MSSENEQKPEVAVRPPRLRTATMVLLFINALVWLVQSVGYRFHSQALSLDDHFALSVEGLRHGHLWQLLSYQFLHSVPLTWHLLFNSWAIFIFGTEVEFSLGKRRMLEIYFLSGIVGGLFQVCGMWLMPGIFGEGSIIGASAGAFGLVAAFAMIYPRERIFVLLFFIIPVRMRAIGLLWLSMALTLFGIAFPVLEHFIPLLERADPLFANVGHAAHLGGMIAGCLLTRSLARRLPPVVNPPVILETAAKA